MIMPYQNRKYQEMFNLKPWLPGEFITDEEFPRIKTPYSMIEEATMRTARTINKMMEPDYV